MSETFAGLIAALHRIEVARPVGRVCGLAGGLVGALSPHVPEQWNTKKQFQLESLLMAEAFWAGVFSSTVVFESQPARTRAARATAAACRSANCCAIVRAGV